MAPPSAFPYRRRISLRWKDNDVYGHVNNVEYYSFFDTVINEYLILEAGLDIHAGEVIGVCAESHCSFRDAIEYPGTILAGLAVERLGSSSVRYAVGLFDGAGDESAARPLAEGWFVHVFVDRPTRRPTPIPGALRARLEAICR
ncbi:MAG TPA: thioesterase family protein [Solirubrobacteraceae bacterium]|nr:thioesterase family protein [Solirubrobacteraceae bacterium]